MCNQLHNRNVYLLYCWQQMNVPGSWRNTAILKIIFCMQRNGHQQRVKINCSAQKSNFGNEPNCNTFVIIVITFVFLLFFLHIFNNLICLVNIFLFFLITTKNQYCKLLVFLFCFSFTFIYIYTWLLATQPQLQQKEPHSLFMDFFLSSGLNT